MNKPTLNKQYTNIPQKDYRINIKKGMAATGLSEKDISKKLFGHELFLGSLLHNDRYKPGLVNVVKMARYFDEDVSKFMPINEPDEQEMRLETSDDVRRFIVDRMNKLDLTAKSVSNIGKSLGITSLSVVQINNLLRLSGRTLDVDVVFLYQLSVVLAVPTRTLIPNDVIELAMRELGGSVKDKSTGLPEGFVELSSDSAFGASVVKFEIKYNRFHLSKSFMAMAGFEDGDRIIAMYNPDKRQLLLMKREDGLKLDNRGYLRNGVMADIMTTIGMKKRVVFQHNAALSEDGYFILDMQGEDPRTRRVS